MQRVLPILSHIYLAAISVLLVIPTPQGPPSDFPLDKIVHFGMFMILVLLYGWTFGKKWKVMGLACIYGFMIEVIQYFIPWRSFEWLDLLADSTGALAGSILLLGLSKIKSE